MEAGGKPMTNTNRAKEAEHLRGLRAYIEKEHPALASEADLDVLTDAASTIETQGREIERLRAELHNADYNARNASPTMSSGHAVPTQAPLQEGERYPTKGTPSVEDYRRAIFPRSKAEGPPQ